MNRSAASVVTSFYDAVSAGDVEAVGALVDEHFASDATLSVPASLPYGGVVTGARRLRRMFTALASGSQAVGPAGITVLTVVDGGSQVAVELGFEWYGPGSTDARAGAAVEVWTFTGGRVESVRSYYWDTAALLATIPARRTLPAQAASAARRSTP